jgi:hypothetical protein
MDDGVEEVISRFTTAGPAIFNSSKSALVEVDGASAKVYSLQNLVMQHGKHHKKHHRRQQ